jgi:acetyltransferase-like isoleucine patch superfamily enzyme
MIKRLLKYVLNKFKYSNLVDFDYSVNISPRSIFEGANNIYNNTKFEGYLGYRSYVGGNSHVCAKVGKFTSIGPYVQVNEGRHPYEAPFVSTSSAFISDIKRKGSQLTTKSFFKEKKYADEANKYPIIIGNDCWIGQGCFFVGGITIGDGAVVLARSVVTKDVPPYAIVGGMPAKIIKYRYDEETRNFLLKFKWWDKSDHWLKENHNLMIDIKALKNKFMHEF